MNGLAHDISMTFRPRPAGVLAIGAALGVLIAASAAFAAPCDVPAGASTAAPANVATDDPAARSAAAREIAAQAELVSRTPGPYPSFCSIPPAPTDLRSPVAWAAAVNDVNAAGAQTQADAASAFSPNESTESFVGAAQREAAPPAPVTMPSSTEAFARSMRGRATPPPRPH
jgi:hypothetical protein